MIIKTPASIDAIAKASKTEIWKWVEARQRFLEWFRTTEEYEFDEQVPALNSRPAIEWFRTFETDPTRQEWLHACDKWGKWTEARHQRHLQENR